MDFSYTPQQEQFRAELRAWLEPNSAEVFGRKGERIGGATCQPARRARRRGDGTDARIPSPPL